jgi:hypothetical protein
VAPWAWRFALGAAVALGVALRWAPAAVPGLVIATLAAGVPYTVLVLPMALRGALASYVRPLLERLRGPAPAPEGR